MIIIFNPIMLKMKGKDCEYEANNVSYDEQYSEETGGGIKCKNYELCHSVLPQWWYDCMGRYTCTHCDMMFGTWGTQTGKGVLQFKDSVECPICYDTKRGVSQARCDHFVCVDCFTTVHLHRR